ncbi:MAG: hypothetical protein ACK4SM_06250 [Aquificaceae bacterium]
MRELLDSFFELHFKKPVEMSYTHVQDILLVSLFLEYFGLDNPLGIYALDLYPELLQEFHIWHRSLGIEKSPISLLPCC